MRIGKILDDLPSIQIHDGPKIIEKRDILTMSTRESDVAKMPGLQYIVRM